MGSKKWLIIAITVLLAVAVAGFVIGQKEEEGPTAQEPVVDQPVVEEPTIEQQEKEAKDHYDLVQSYTVTAKWGNISADWVTLLQTDLINRVMDLGIKEKDITIESYDYTAEGDFLAKVLVGNKSYSYLYYMSIDGGSTLELID